MIFAMVELLANFYRSGDLLQMEAIARSMLAAMPDDLVALQFLGLALYQSGRIDDAYRVFRRVAMRRREAVATMKSTVYEAAAAVSYREAIRPNSGLADGWQRIAELLTKFGFRKSARQARAAAMQSRGGAGPRLLTAKM